MAGEQAGVERRRCGRRGRPSRPPAAARSGRPSRGRRRWRHAGRAPRAAPRSPPCGGRSCTSRRRAACPSARSPAGRGDAAVAGVAHRRRAPCATETTTSARRGRTRPAHRRPRRGGRAAARRARGRTTETGSREAPRAARRGCVRRRSSAQPTSARSSALAGSCGACIAVPGDRHAASSNPCAALLRGGFCVLAWRSPGHALHTPQPPAAHYGPSTIACAASDATVTSITLEKRSHAIRFSACSRSSIAWKANACERRTYRRAIVNV